MIGRVYKIIHSQSDICYIGSTLNVLKQRWQMHKIMFKRWINDEAGKLTIFPYFKEHGVEQFRIILIKEYKIVDRKHLEAYEQLWINKFSKTAVNNRCAFSIGMIQNKAKSKQYREANKEKCLAYAKKHREANKEKYLEYDKKYREANKEKRSSYAKQWTKNNESKLKEKFSCNCGGKYTKDGRTQHFKTKKHQNWLEKDRVEITSN